MMRVVRLVSGLSLIVLFGAAFTSNSASSCEPGWVKNRSGTCMPMGNVDCGTGGSCPAGTICAPNHGCHGGGPALGPRCGSNACQLGWACGKNDFCYNPRIAHYCGDALCSLDATCGPNGTCVSLTPRRAAKSQPSTPGSQGTSFFGTRSNPPNVRLGARDGGAPVSGQTSAEQASSISKHLQRGELGQRGYDTAPITRGDAVDARLSSSRHLVIPPELRTKYAKEFAPLEEHRSTLERDIATLREQLTVQESKPRAQRDGSSQMAIVSLRQQINNKQNEVNYDDVKIKDKIRTIYKLDKGGK